MESIPMNRASAEKEGLEVQERAKSQKQLPDAPIDAADYLEAHDQITAERLKEMREYIEITGGQNNPEYHNLIVEFMARNYRIEELKKIGLKLIRLIDEIRYYKTMGDEAGDDNAKTEPYVYKRDDYQKAKESSDLPTGDEWLRARAVSHWQKDDKEYGSIEIFDPYDYPYELPEHVESSSKKDQALLTYLLGHEVGHFVYSNVYLKNDLSLRDDVPERTEFGRLLFTNNDGKLGYNYDYIRMFMESPFTPYLKVRVKALQPLYAECLETQDPEKTNRFMYEFSEYYAEFFSEAAALAKTKNLKAMDDNEKYFVACYDQAESIMNRNE